VVHAHLPAESLHARKAEPIVGVGGSVCTSIRTLHLGSTHHRHLGVAGLSAAQFNVASCINGGQLPWAAVGIHRRQCRFVV